MIKRLRITDLTRMGPPRVCVAGYDETGACVRPMPLYSQIREDDLELDDGWITPFAEVEYDLATCPCTPPHHEDEYYQPGNVRWIRRMSEAERFALLHESRQPRLDQAFGAPLVQISNHFVRAGSGDRSLVTIQADPDVQVQLLEKEGTAKWRLLFRDASKLRYNLPITDLAWHYFAAVQRRFGGSDMQILERRLSRILHKELLFLRIGLGREYPAGSHQCWLQVNGIYSFPDYLEGASFLDFRAGLAATAT